MEISQLNSMLIRLSPSEERYRRGERYDWERENRRVSLDGRSVFRIEQSGTVDRPYRELEITQTDCPPLLGSLSLRRNSRFNPVPEHVHENIEISYVYAGNCPQVIDGHPVTLRENQVLLLDTNCPHAIGELGEGAIMMSLVLNRDFLRSSLLGTFTHESILSQFFVNALNDETDHNRYVRFHAQRSRRVRRYFQEIMCEYFDPSNNADRVLLNLLQLLFAELISVYEEDYVKRDKNHGAISVIPIIRYIEKHYRTCTQESVAEHFAVSPNYVTVLLKRHTGMTYVQAVQAQRLGHAASMLRNTGRTIDDIAREVGYENQSFFYRKFRAQYGMNPAAYRAQHQPAS